MTDLTRRPFLNPKLGKVSPRIWFHWTLDTKEAMLLPTVGDTNGLRQQLLTIGCNRTKQILVVIIKVRGVGITIDHEQ